MARVVGWRTVKEQKKNKKRKERWEGGRWNEMREA